MKAVQSTARSAATIKEHGHAEVQSKVIPWSSHVKKHLLDSVPEYLSWKSLWDIVSSCYSHSLPFLVYIPYSAPFFLHYLEHTLHALTPQTFILYLTSSVLWLSNTFSYLREHRPFKYMWHMILVFIQKTRKTTSTICIKLQRHHSSLLAFWTGKNPNVCVNLKQGFCHVSSAQF